MDLRKVMTCAALIPLTGCWMRPTPAVVPESNLAFHHDKKDRDVLVYRNSSRSLLSYSQFLVDPVRVRSEDLLAMRSTDQAFLVEAFRDELLNALKQRHEISTVPGPNVLRIRSTIQDVSPTYPEFDPEKCVVLKLSSLLSRASIEIECDDSLTGEPVVALVHTVDRARFADRNVNRRLMSLRDVYGIWVRSLVRRFDEAQAASR